MIIIIWISWSLQLPQLHSKTDKKNIYIYHNGLICENDNSYYGFCMAIARVLGRVVAILLVVVFSCAVYGKTRSGKLDCAFGILQIDLTAYV